MSAVPEIMCGTPAALDRNPQRRTLAMKEDHANMPGMSEQPKKTEQGKPSATPQKAQESKQPDPSSQSDKAKPQPAPEKS